MHGRDVLLTSTCRDELKIMKLSRSNDVHVPRCFMCSMGNLRCNSLKLVDLVRIAAFNSWPEIRSGPFPEYTLYQLFLSFLLHVQQHPGIS